MERKSHADAALATKTMVGRKTGLALLERQSFLGYLLMAPAAFIIFFFVAYPFTWGVWMSLTNKQIGMPWSQVRFTGLRNYVDLLTKDGIFWTTFWNSFAYTGFATVIKWSPSLALASVTFVNIWRGTPFFAISFLAGLQTISPDLYEAAAIDGASGWQRFRHVTLPGIKPITVVVLVFSIIVTFSDFQIVYVLTRGGPANSTHLFATYAYQVAMVGSRLGLGAAISLFMFPFLALLIIFQLFYLRREQA